VRCAAAHVEHARLVVPREVGDHAIPVVGADQRPGGDGAQVHPAGPKFLRVLPHLDEPADLFIARGAVVAFGDRDRPLVPFPRLFQQSGHAERRVLEVAHRIHVHVRHARAVAEIAVGERPVHVPLEAVVQQALARQVMVDADDVRRAWIVRNRAQATFESERDEPLPQLMARHHHAAEQVPPHPAARVLEVRLASQRSGGVAVAEVVRLDQARVGPHLADLPHRKARRVDLVEQRVPEERLVRRVRVPVPVQRAEARGGQRLVDRCPVADPLVALGNRRGVTGQAQGEAVVDRLV
jgi:hypothetical protein